ncbi:MAG: branched-chain amino acid ABC transporter permease [Lachnospiraceae bacterium]|nr:branched-chain amino acid ABC transporter permease [Lachnospiraceae bacterium]
MQAVLVQLVLSGIAMGFVYALVAIEYTLIYNSCGLLNFSHDKIITLGGYFFVGTFLMDMNWSNIPAVLGSVLTLALLGVIIAFVIFIPLKNKPRLIAIVATIMLGQMINEIAPLIWGGLALNPMNFLSGTTQIFGATVATAYLYIIVVSVIILILLQYMLKRTKLGKAMTSVALNKTAASLMGVNVTWNMAITIMISFVICGILGILCAPIFTVTQTMASMISLKGFAAGVIGGFGNLPAAIFGGLFLAIAENLICLALPSVFKDVVAFVLMIAFMLFFPNGMAGIKENIKKRQIRKQMEVEL